MTLSSKIIEINYNNCRYISGFLIPKKDVKEFIKELKEELMNDIDLKKHKTIIEVKIDKKAGENLI